MGKVYQPIVLEYVENLILGLEDGNFFEDYEIEDLTFVREHLSEKFTEKFIEGTLEESFEEIFDEDEFQMLLKELVAGSILYELKEKKFVNSVEDINGEEVFFLTEDGKTFLNTLDE